MNAPLLVLGWGNRSRGDDALGPLFVEQLRAACPERDDVEWLDDYQLQIEHALDLVGRERVLLVDASLKAAPPFETSMVEASEDASFSTHALSPQAVLQVFRKVHHAEPPPCTLLALRGEQFELGSAPSAAALQHLQAALRWGLGWLSASASTTS